MKTTLMIWLYSIDDENYYTFKKEIQQEPIPNHTKVRIHGFKFKATCGYDADEQRYFIKLGNRPKNKLQYHQIYILAEHLKDKDWTCIYARSAEDV
jgi:hypothetical protein